MNGLTNFAKTLVVVTVTAASLSQCNRGNTNKIAIEVGAEGYRPTQVSTRANVATTLVFTRTSDGACGEELVFPLLNIRRRLPLNEPVEVSFTPASSGMIRFTCGMGMMRGSVVVQ